jgi:hypothetical protein
MVGADAGRRVQAERVDPRSSLPEEAVFPHIERSKRQSEPIPGGLVCDYFLEVSFRT